MSERRMTSTQGGASQKGRLLTFVTRAIKPNAVLYAFMLPAFIYAIIFLYRPMYGLIIAFKDYNPGLGFMGSPWVGFKHFERFFNSYIFWSLLGNTLILSLYTLLASMPLPVVLALMLNYCYHRRFRKLVQTTTYAPYFISLVVLVGMMHVFLSTRYGIVNTLLAALGFEKIGFMFQAEWFRHLFVLSGVWQRTGFASIIYLAVLSGVSPELHEAAIVDGAAKITRVANIDLPFLAPTIVILLIINLGHAMNVGFEKVLLMRNAGNIQVAEIIQTYVYELGIKGGEFSYTTAIGFFRNTINLTLLLLANAVARKLSNTSVI